VLYKNCHSGKVLVLTV